MTRAPIREKIKGLRQRQRSDGTWRVWWEPSAEARAAGAKAVDLDADRPAWSIREATQLNKGPRPARTAPGGRTMAALIHLYRQDEEFTDRRPKTRASYAQLLGVIEDKWGAVRAVEFTKPVMREWYLTERKHRGLTMANRLVAMMSILFSFAELKGWRPEDSNPCRKLKRSAADPRNRVATWEEVDALVAAADAAGHPAIGTGVLMAVLLGQRWTDLFSARRKDFLQLEDPAGSGDPIWAWKLTRSKRGTRGMVPVHPLLMWRLQPLLRGNDGDAPLLQIPGAPMAYSEDAFQRQFVAIRKAAATTAPTLLDPVLQFRDLRRTFGVWSRSAGTSKSDVGDVLGNSAGQNAHLQNVYMGAEFETVSRAVLAIQRPAQKKRRA